MVDCSFVNGDSSGVAEVTGKEKPLVANHGIGANWSPKTRALRSGQTNTMSVDTQRTSPIVQATPTSLMASTPEGVDADLPFDVVAAYRRQLLDDNVRESDCAASRPTISSDTPPQLLFKLIDHCAFTPITLGLMGSQNVRCRLPPFSRSQSLSRILEVGVSGGSII